MMHQNTEKSEKQLFMKSDYLMNKMSRYVATYDNYTGPLILNHIRQSVDNINIMTHKNNHMHAFVITY